MAWSVDDLVATLVASEESSYVRVVADWLVRGAYSLAHAPAEFAARGVIVEQDSLVSV